MNEQQPSAPDQPPQDAEARNFGRPPMGGSLTFLDELQESMEAIALGQNANDGRFCGYCYGRLAEPNRRKPSRLPASVCRYCGTSTDDVDPAARIPAEVLAVYLAKRRREGLIVNLFAFLGIFLALLLSAAVWLLTPDNFWKIAPFAVLLFGSYYLARVIGYNVGVPLGSASGRNLRNARWDTFVQKRLGPSGRSSSGPQAAKELLNGGHG